MSRAEMVRLGWDELDVIIVSGDAYVDHPAFGTAVIARVLLGAGYRVGVIAQPRWTTVEDVARLGRPRLFFGVTAGNVDSLVASHSPAGRRRLLDDYSPGGRPGLRPDRATTVYCNLVSREFKDVPLVIGGIEASLRRLAHYDFQNDAVRRSILLDTRADVLCYGMAETAVLEIAARLAAGGPAVFGSRQSPFDRIPGTCVVRRALPAEPHVLLPSFERVAADKAAFVEAFRHWFREHADPGGRQV
ncbi:YgiQ family radical SAM protein, partial [candidate division WOR-3 bacterium]|nr:YgiQ family radical SAM protein [candidate division WOR-3 bacterium]